MTAATAPLLPPCPTTPLARAAEQLLRRSSPTVLVEHCLRTFAFGSVLLRRAGRAVDVEALFIGSCLHDLGLLPENEDGRTPFQLRGAGLASDLVLQGGGTRELAHVVHEAVALHLELSTGEHPDAAVAGVSLGAAVDVLGLGLASLPEELVEAALLAHPRGGMKDWFVAAMSAEAERKPDSTIGGYVRDLGFCDLIRAAPFPT